MTPIPLTHPALSSKETAAIVSGPAGLRGRVEQQVDALAGSANKVISGVVDSGFGVLRAFLPTQNGDQAPASPDSVSVSAPWNRPAFGLLRRESGFSIASLAASLPAAARERARSIASSHHPQEDDGQEMIESRPGSLKNVRLDEDASSGEESSAEDGDDDQEEQEDTKYDTRSIRSFESMLSTRSRQQKADKKDRMSLTDRLAHMSRLTRGSSHSQEASVPQVSNLFHTVLFRSQSNLYRHRIHRRCAPPRCYLCESQRGLTLLSPRAPHPLRHMHCLVSPPQTDVSLNALQMTSECLRFLHSFRNTADSPG